MPCNTTSRILRIKISNKVIMLNILLNKDSLQDIFALKMPGC